MYKGCITTKNAVLVGSFKLEMSVNTEFRVDVGDVHIDIESFIGLKLFKLPSI
jgi:hypothetical protein